MSAVPFDAPGHAPGWDFGRPYHRVPARRPGRRKTSVIRPPSSEWIISVYHLGETSRWRHL
jgi:hypothetical protein